MSKTLDTDLFDADSITEEEPVELESVALLQQIPVQLALLQ